MPKSRKPSPWKAFGALGAVLGTIGVIEYARRAKRAVADATLPTTTDPMLQPITDPTLIRYWQTEVADALDKGQAIEALPGLTGRDYNKYDVDGDPNNPKWRRALSAFQTAINGRLGQLSPQDRANLPANFPAQLRTDGVLDNATLIAMKKS